MIAVPHTAHAEQASAFCGREKNDVIIHEEVFLIALARCSSRVAIIERVSLLVMLLEIENSFSPPVELTGMLLAAACLESRYNANAKGDHKFSKRRKPKAIGLLQIWPWAIRANEKRTGKKLVRIDPLQSAIFWMDHIKRQLPRVKRVCGFKLESRLWSAAWVTAIRAPKPGGRCYERSKHERLLHKWHREIRKKRTACLPSNLSR